jgi:hypothetical protein
MSTPEAPAEAPTVAPDSTAALDTHELLHTATPLITMGATWAARKSMIKVYEAATGRPAPLVRSRESSVAAKILWAAALAGVVALVEVVIWQVLDDE